MPSFDPYSFDWGSVMPEYQAPDLSGIYGRLDQLQQAQSAQPTAPSFDPYSFDWGSVMPEYQAPDLSGIYGRLDQLQQALSSYGQVADTSTAGSLTRPSLAYDDGMSGLDTFAKGGDVNMQNGSFVLDARTVSELGNGSSNAGKEILARMGGKPLDGPGDGVSDSIRARIGGTQEARVARDEVILPPEAVRRMGGTKKLYALMDKAHKARKKAKRGEDTKLRRGLA